MGEWPALIWIIFGIKKVNVCGTLKNKKKTLPDLSEKFPFHLRKHKNKNLMGMWPA